MRPIALFALPLLAVALLAAPADAHKAQEKAAPRKKPAHTVNQRQKAQKTRIQEGVKSGDLTRKEAGKLIQQDQRIKAMEADLRADGKLTAEERLRLQKALDAHNKAIYKQKHDAQQQSR